MTMGLAFVALSAIAWWRHRTTASEVLIVLGMVFLLTALIVPEALPPVHRTWMRGAQALSRITTPIILGILYFVVITPIGFLMRAFGRDPLPASRHGESAWSSRAGASRSDLRRQF